MVDNYEDILKEWAAPCQESCNDMMEIIPSEDMTRWAVRKIVTVLANADYYYTKSEVDNLIERATASGVTEAEVEEMIQSAIASKADISQVYTKQETDSLLSNYLSKLEAIRMRNNYSRVEGETLILNSEF